jgi:DNA replication protein DnaC
MSTPSRPTPSPKAKRPEGGEQHLRRGQRGPKGAEGAPLRGAERSRAASASATESANPSPTTSGVDLDAIFRRLHLANARRVWRELCRKAEAEDWTYQHLLEILVTEEIAHRRQTRLGRVCRNAQFPFLKTIDDFDFTFQSSLRLSMLGTFLSADFITEGRNLILVGRTGRGKTHLAVALGYRAIQNGFDARFTTAAALIDALSSASRAGQLREALHEWVHPAVLVVDEVGYLAYGTDAANLFFHVVNERHLKRRSMIFTTNKALKVWGKVLHDEDLGDTIVDRILERGTVVRLDGPSVRSRHVTAADLEGPELTADEVGSPARISGMNRPEFPEPTQ